MTERTRGLLVAGLIAGLMMTTCPAALAQTVPSTNSATKPAAPSANDGSTVAEPDQGGLGDIVVTATRVATNVQDVPIAISAIGGDSLRDSNITDPRQLSGLAPNLNVDQGLGNGATHVSIRGLASTDFGLGASSPVATYIDDVYQPFQYGIGTQIFDLNRIEVLRGPQGTLFGKNTTGGALNYYSQTPVPRDEGYLLFDGGGGDFDHYAVEGAFNKVLSDNLASRLSFRVTRRNNYIDNLLDGSGLGEYSSYNLRWQFAWKPKAGTAVNLKLFGLKNTGDGPIYVTLGDPASLFAPDSRKVYSENPQTETFDNYGATLRIDQDLGDWTATSVSGAQEGHYSVATNDDGVGFDIFHSRQRSKTWLVSQELRVASPTGAPVHGVAGVYGSYDEIMAVQGSVSNRNAPADNFALANIGDQHTTTFAGFGSLTWDATNRLSLIGGLRYSYERKSIDVPFALYTGRQFVDDDTDYGVLVGKYPFNPLTDYMEMNQDRHSWRKLNFDATVNFKPSERSLLYGKVATGFRSGGYPVGVAAPASFVRLAPENVTSYEGGFKSEWLNRRLRINGSAFLMDYDDLQVQTPRTDGTPGLVLSNAATARVRGVELEVEAAPFDGLHLSGSVGYNDARYRQFGLQSGNRLPYAPKWSGNAGVEYKRSVRGDHEVTFSVDSNIRSRLYFDPYQLMITSDRARALVNGRVGFGTKGDGWHLSVYVLNATNQDMKAFAFALDATSGIAPTIYASKRTWGLTARFDF